MDGIVETFAAIRKKLTKATGDALGEVHRVRVSIKEKRAALAALGRSALPMAEAAARARDVVRRDGDAWLAAHGSRFLTMGSVRARALAQGGGQGPIGLPFDQGAPVPWGFTCVAAPEVAVAQLMAVLHRLEAAGLYRAGPEAAARSAVIAKAEAELVALEHAEEQLVDEANEAGLNLAHRPEVAQRRATEARRLQLEEQAVAGRGERQAALDADHEGARTTRSKYLATAAGLGPDRLP